MTDKVTMKSVLDRAIGELRYCHGGQARDLDNKRVPILKTV